MRSPGAMRHSTSRSTVFGGYETDDVEQVDDVLAEPRGRQAGQRDRVAQGRLVGDQLGGRVHPELRLRGARRCAAAQPRQLLAHQVLPLGLGDRRHPVALHPLQHVRGVPALERLDDAVVHLPGRGRHLVEEPPVVGHHHERRPSSPTSAPSGAAASHATPSRSRWLVGSSRKRMSWSCTSSAASATRRRWPPESSPIVASQRMSATRPAEHVPDARVARPQVLVAVADDGVTDRELSGRGCRAGRASRPSRRAAG